MNNNFLFLNFAVEKLKEITNVGTDKFIPWGYDNKKPFEYIDLSDNIPEHYSALSFNSDLTIGQGIDFTGIDYWDVKKVVNDFLTFGGYSIQVIKLRNGEKKYEYVKFENIRLTEKGLIAYSDDFTKYNSKIKYYPKSDGTTDGIYVYFNIATRGKYPKPYYHPANTSLDTMQEICKHHNNNAKNGFSASILVNYNSGIPESEEQMIIESGFKRNFTGSEGKKIIVAFNKDKDTQTTIEKIQADNLDEKFETLQKFIQNQIIIAHRLPSGSLIGVKPENQGFSKTEYEEALTIHKDVTIKGFRNELEYSFKELFKIDVKFLDVEDITQPTDTNTQNIL